MIAPEVKNALVVGGGSGMGRAAALALAAAGARVMVADLDLAAAQATASQAGGGSLGWAVDVADPASVAGLFAQLREEIEALHMLVHTAAILGGTAFIDEVSDAAWRRMMAVNLDGPFYCSREAVRWMKRTGGGRILLFSSVASLTPTPGALPYSAAKGGVNMLARTLAAEAAKHNIRVNVIAPGYVRTPMLEGLPSGFAEYIVKKTPLGRLGEESEVAALVAYLAGPQADFFTGQVLSPNGGLVI
ncbi:SDR family NAD(P)-dependent oxidoreductase [Desulfoferula mesophila]|uniref:3-oxoacyl-ACP reductase n=1 Tax=Desulfoferula mesophila TaxID=3058419 RepID=A0AAU9ESH1_9BACT|nr:3-oxoacyl-ACP reductase [Desulfoferula mesophilus]